MFTVLSASERVSLKLRACLALLESEELKYSIRVDLPAVMRATGGRNDFTVTFRDRTVTNVYALVDLVKEHGLVQC